MRSFVCFGLVAIATVFIASNSASAVVLGGGGNGGGGYNEPDNNGKSNSKYCIYIKNKDHYKGMACWIHVDGSDYPTTLGYLRSEMIYIDPYATGKSDKLKKGYYCVSLFCSEDLYGPSYHEIDYNFYYDYEVDKLCCQLDKQDKYLCCDRYSLWYDDSYGNDNGYGNQGY